MTRTQKTSWIRKVAPALALALTAGALSPTPRAEAGIILTAGGAGAITYIFTGQNVTDGDLGIWYLGLLGAGGGLALTIVGACTANIPLIVLDDDGARDSVESRLAKDLPFLADQPEALSDLARSFTAHAKIAAESADPSAKAILVSVPESEVRLALANSLVSAEQIRKAVQFLK